MTIEKLDEGKLLISLCIRDMEKLAIAPDTMSLKDPDFKDTVKAILSLAAYESGISTRGRRAVIEALPHENGCFLLVSFINKTKYGKKYRIIKRSENVYSAESLDVLIDLSFALTDMSKIGENTIIEYDHGYILIIKGISPMAERTVREFTVPVKVRKIEISRYREYGKVLIEKNALEILNKAFKKSRRR